MKKQSIKQSFILRLWLLAKRSVADWIGRTFTKVRLMKTAALMIVIVVVSIYTHAFQFPSDKAMENKIRDDILDDGTARFEDLFPGVDQVCFLQFYSNPSFLPVPNIEKKRLARFANSYYGTGDHVWWLALIKNKNVIEFYRMRGRTSSNLHNPECFSTNNTIAAFSNIRDYHLHGIVYFNIERSVNYE